jgi:hypothetical protein
MTLGSTEALISMKAAVMAGRNGSISLWPMLTMGKVLDRVDLRLHQHGDVELDQASAKRHSGASRALMTRLAGCSPRWWVSASSTRCSSCEKRRSPP